MKRILSLAMVFVLMLSLAACGGSSDGDAQKPASVSTNNSGSVENRQSGQPEESEAAISETVLVDEAGVKITAKNLSSELFGTAIKLLIENDSGKDLTFQCRNASVNGYMVETMLSADIVSGKKANDELIFMSSDLDACGISTIADMEFSFHIFTTEDWETYLDTPQIQIKTSASDTYEYTFDTSGVPVYDGNGVKIVAKGLSDDSILGPGIIVYIENNREEIITVQTRDVSINGFMVDTIFSPDVVNGKRAVDAITFLSSDLEANEIFEISEVELSFHIFNTADWETIVDTDAVTLTF